MKLIVTGATGFVGQEVVRQALHNPAVTTVVVLARRPQPRETSDGGVHSSRLSWVVLDDWEHEYSKDIKEALAGADACIWCLATTPTQSVSMDPAEVKKVCHDYTLVGLESMAKVAAKPIRFVYLSGLITERNPDKPALMPGGYLHMRGAVENAVLDFSSRHAPDVQATVAKPGIIEGPNSEPGMMHTVLKQIYGYVPSVHVSEVAAAMIYECLTGISKDPLDNEDLKRVGKKLIGENSSCCA